MNILFVHQNFPAQYKHIAPAMAARGHRVVAVGLRNWTAKSGIEYVRYETKRGTTTNIHPWVIDYEAKVIRAEACAEACLNLSESGFEPDVICVHPGWGEALLLREVWPNAKQIHFVEFFYGSEGKDVGFDPEFPMPAFSGKCRLHIKNTNNLMNLIDMDAGISPTEWQRSTVPDQFKDKIRVIHDGVDTKSLTPDSAAAVRVKNDRGETREFSSSDRILTFVNRNLEPSRGYHQFMRALPEILRGDPEVQVVIIGGDGVSYGAAPTEGSWKELYLNEVREQLDMSRVHFLGRVNYDVFINMLRLSSAHIYLTYPFVLSWSMLEAMSLGAPVIGSDTPPVREVIRDGENGWLVDFFDPHQIAGKALEVLRSDVASVRVAARQTVVDNYDLENCCLPAQIDYIESLSRNA